MSHDMSVTHLSIISSENTSLVEDPVVVYHIGKELYWKDIRSKYEQRKDGTFVPIPGTDLNPRLEIKERNVKFFIAQIDLRKLGSDIRLQRKSGKLTDVFVLGQHADGATSHTSTDTPLPPEFPHRTRPARLMGYDTSREELHSRVLHRSARNIESNTEVHQKGEVTESAITEEEHVAVDVAARLPLCSLLSARSEGFSRSEEKKVEELHQQCVEKCSQMWESMSPNSTVTESYRRRIRRCLMILRLWKESYDHMPGGIQMLLKSASDVEITIERILSNILSIVTIGLPEALGLTQPLKENTRPESGTCKLIQEKSIERAPAETARFSDDHGIEMVERENKSRGDLIIEELEEYVQLLNETDIALSFIENEVTRMTKRRELLAGQKRHQTSSSSTQEQSQPRPLGDIVHEDHRHVDTMTNVPPKRTETHPMNDEPLKSDLEPSWDSAKRQRVTSLDTFVTVDSKSSKLKMGHNLSKNSMPSGNTANLDTKAPGSIQPLLEYAWIRQSVLSLDEGGVRGYSSLAILRILMDHIVNIETSMDEAADTSYHPMRYRPRPHRFGAGRSASWRKDDCSYPHYRRSKFLCAHYFDYIGGSGTGGLISIMLGRLRMTIDDSIEAYHLFGGKIFGDGRLFSQRGPFWVWWRAKYNGTRLKEAVEEIVSDNLPWMQPIFGPSIFSYSPHLCKTVCFAYSSKPMNVGRAPYRDAATDVRQESPSTVGPYIFRSYNHFATLRKNNKPQFFPRNPGAAPTISIQDVACATTAAPTYFAPVQIGGRKYGDGGFGCANPVQELRIEVETRNAILEEKANFMLSIGTGESKRFHRIPINGGLQQLYEYWRAAKKLASDSVEAHDSMSQHCEKSSNGWVYHRLNVTNKYELGDMKLDEWEMNGKTLDKIEEETRKYCDEIHSELEEIARQLVERRRARCKGARWDFFSTGDRYRCILTPCAKSQKQFGTREALLRHVKLEHPSYNLDDCGAEQELF